MTGPAGAFPDETTDPDDLTGAAYAARVKAEGDALWKYAIRNTASIGGTANAITAVCVPPLTGAPGDGHSFSLTPAANNTGAVTVNHDGGGAIALKSVDGADLVADDLVAGRPAIYRRHGADGPFRLVAPTERALLAALAASIAGQEQVVKIASTVLAAPASQVEHTFDADAYSRILFVFDNVYSTTGSVWNLIVTLRDSSGAIVTLTWGGGVISTLAGGALATGVAEFIVPKSGLSNGIHYGRIKGAVGGTPRTLVEAGSSGSVVANRVRAILSGGATLGGGRFTTYGWKS